MVFGSVGLQTLFWMLGIHRDIVLDISEHNYFLLIRHDHGWYKDQEQRHTLFQFLYNFFDQP